MHTGHTSSITITTRNDAGSPASATANAELLGCRNCLVNALAHLMAENESFRKLINKAGRMANELRGKTQN